MLQSCCNDIICNTYDLILMSLADMLINLSLHTKYLPANNYSLLRFRFSLSLYQYHSKNNVTFGLLFDCSTYADCDNIFMLCYVINVVANCLWRLTKGFHSQRKSTWMPSSTLRSPSVNRCWDFVKVLKWRYINVRNNNSIQQLILFKQCSSTSLHDIASA